MKETKAQRNQRIKQSRALKLRTQTEGLITKYGLITQAQINKWHEEIEIKAEHRLAGRKGR